MGKGERKLRENDKVLLVNGNIGEIVYVLQTMDIVRVKLENGIFISIRNEDVKKVIET